MVAAWWGPKVPAKKGRRRKDRPKGSGLCVGAVPYIFNPKREGRWLRVLGACLAPWAVYAPPRFAKSMRPSATQIRTPHLTPKPAQDSRQ